MPNRYRTIVADPPWPYPEGWPPTRWHLGAGATNSTGPRRALPYPAMELDAITALPLQDLAEDDAHLFLWTTNRYLIAAHEVAIRWGFRPSQVLTWCKPVQGLGPGGVFASTSEFIVYARRGKPGHLQRARSTWFEWPRRGHSAKPDAFSDLIEKVLPGPYLELFARRARFGWDVWGNEAPNPIVWDIAA